MVMDLTKKHKHNLYFIGVLFSYLEFDLFLNFVKISMDKLVNNENQNHNLSKIELILNSSLPMDDSHTVLIKHGLILFDYIHAYFLTLAMNPNKNKMHLMIE